MLPSLSTAMVMFSGLVWVGMLTALGRVSGTVLVITGIVMRKMMSSTSITPTSAVLLMVPIMPPLLASPTFIDMVSYSLKRVRRAGTPPARMRRTRAAARPQAASANGRRGLGRGRTGATAAATLDLHAAYEVGMQVAGEVPQRVL